MELSWWPVACLSSYSAVLRSTRQESQFVPESARPQVGPHFERTSSADVIRQRNRPHLELEPSVPDLQLHLLPQRLLAPFLELDQLPSRILFIGGGYIAFEFAHVAVRAGAEVTILHRGSRPLTQFDADLVDRLVERTRALGVDVQLGTKAVGVEKRGERFTVDAETATGKRAYEAAMVVHAAGRVPEIDDLDLGVAGVQYEDRQGVKVNGYLQSISNPAVYAAGDAAASGGAPLTAVAGYEGSIVADNLLQGNHRQPEYPAVPSVVFTIPPLSGVGLQEKTAREQGRQFDSELLDTSNWYSYRRVGEEWSGAKVLVEQDSGRILGAHLLGPQADEMINMFALAIRVGMRAAELKEVLFAYPTHASDIQYML